MPPKADEPYDFRKDPEWMLGGKYRDPEFPRPWLNPAPVQPPAPAPVSPLAPRAASPLVPPSGLAAAVKRVFTSDYVPPWDRHKAANPATKPTLA